MSDKHSEFFKSFLETALKSGANNFGRQLLNAVNDENQPAEIILGRIATALKSGAVATGQEVLRAQLDQLKN
ncbi:hypothetical protein M5X00_16715 [Paenibacillus alvei]|uniref:Uncharacterized protein n=2 Tax=Paenibacillus alvei TaxID=44250 RepID=A0ABT4H541_PAEAL|nr:MULTISPECIES: hypothetical protein [Paenibacillus]MCY7486850.1 hypothetical protein [Paenibacillus alvei]MCY9540576.1 hypothetical protein [Paenibacillus alvei]MCY9706977.1 hypothetical protein [Paenibacillus alvei]MCY9736053.1 hypothetical protein [Paenibacillus alvei]MCY9755883.1 hypothetical protein [Paenibacillus alvei]